MSSSTKNLEELPDNDIRNNIRQMCGMWLDILSLNGDICKQLEYKKKFIKKLKTSPIAINTDLANEQHYEVPTNFFLKVLGPKLKYSCCYWPEDCKTLEESETHFFNLLFSRCNIKDGMTILDLGCGWGTTSLELLSRYPSCNVIAVSNSNTQREYIQSIGNKKGYNNRLTVITCDANEFKPPNNILFDRVISVEMFEHMKNYQELMKRISSWLKDDGYLFVHILCHYKYSYPFISKEGSDTEWMAKNFFSGGTMPSSDLLLFFQDHLTIDNIWLINGTHYSKTLEAWLERMDSQKQSILQIFKNDQKLRTKSKLLSQKEAQEELDNYWKKWRTFFIYCAEVFNYNEGKDWMVAQYMFTKKQLTSKI